MVGRFEYLVCPQCQSSDLDHATDEPLGSPTATGFLVCRSCAGRYDVIDGIAHLHVDDHSWLSKQREAAGWESFASELGQLHYEGIGAPPVDFVIPYIDDEPWATMGRNFDRLVADVDLVGARTLDVGASRPWAAKQFALRGAQTSVAVDVNAHQVVGLGRGWAMAEEAGVELDLVVGDSERLPFADDWFDVVFISAAMHHTNFIRRLARELERVLAPRGTLIVANEPTRPGAGDESDLLLESAQMELRHGITERRPAATEYLEAISATGLRVEALQLGPDCEEPGEIWGRLKAPALLPPREQWRRRGTARRVAGSLRVRWRSLPHEHRFRRALPRSARGVRSSHAQMMSCVYGTPDINIVARKT